MMQELYEQSLSHIVAFCEEHANRIEEEAAAHANTDGAGVPLNPFDQAVLYLFAHPEDILADVPHELEEHRHVLLCVGAKVCRQLIDLPPDTPLSREICMGIVNDLYDKADGLHLTAYFYAVKVISDLLYMECDITVDELGDDLLDDRPQPEYTSFADIPANRRLLYVKNRLLDFSRANPLVHFKPLRVNIPIASPAPHEILRALREQERVPLGAWSNTSASCILRCSACGRHFLRKFQANTDEVAMPCPDCDEGQETMRVLPLPERPLFVSSEHPFIATCESCGAENPITEPVSDLYPRCATCDAELPLPSYPVLAEDALDTFGEVVCIPAMGDRRCLQAADSLVKYAAKLKNNYGLHSIYLAAGFLHWRAANGQAYNSPLLLCKVELGCDKAQGRIHLDMADTGEDTFTVNHTLRKMLESYAENISISLPDYKPDEPVDAYIRKLMATLGQFPVARDWTADSETYIGKFYYHKLQLEQDFDENFDLYAAHPLVRLLCGLDPLEEEAPEERRRAGQANFTILNADSSQDSVVAAARAGKSFILQGPPGTGKSQTITNIIADALGNGKTVLFVTEKASARNVIIDNLEDCRIGTIPTDGSRCVGTGRSLNEFVLNAENMATKKGTGDINKTDLRRFLNDSFAPAELVPWREATPDISLVESRLQEVYDVLTAIPFEGETILHLIEQWIPLADCETMDFPGAAMDAIDLPAASAFIQNFYHLTESLAEDFSGSAMDYTRHPLYGYTERNLLCPSLGRIQELRARLHELEEESDLLPEELGYTAIGDTIEELRASLALPYALVGRAPAEEDAEGNAASPTAHASLDAGIPEICFHVLAQNRTFARQSPADYLRSTLEYVKKRQADRAELRRHPYFDMERYVHVEAALRTNTNALRTELEEFSFFTARVGKKYNDLKVRLAEPLLERPDKLSYRDCLDILAMLDACQVIHRDKLVYEEDFPTDKKTFGTAFDGWNTDLDGIVRMLNEGIAVFEDYDPDRLADLLDRTLDAYTHGKDYRVVVRKSLAHMESAISAVEASLHNLEDVFDTRIVPFHTMDLVELGKYFERFDLPLHKLSLWTELQMLLFSIHDDRDMTRILKILIRRHPETADEAVNMVTKAHYRAVIMAKLNQYPDLFPFLSREGMERAIAKYCTGDALWLRSAPTRLYNHLLQTKNDACDAFYAEFKRKNLIQKYVGISTKELIRSHWDEIRVVTPCIMMSPLNVSQYLDISVEFDLVIFDEASQIFLEESLASVVRGRQLIISGDRNQLPPFDFARSVSALGGSDMDPEESFESGESILTAALRTSLDTNSLRWHYRSADESLICFSNRYFYDNRLVTFPAAYQNPDYGIFHHYVDNGCYLSARERINEEEAEKVVELLYREMTAPKHKNNSIGVVAFNLAQAEAIEDAWFRFLSANYDPAVDEWAARMEARNEPLIFCNLDTIQGDERDTMIISTTYGYNQEDLFRLSFLGPVRHGGGKKRINVAITRAKRRMMVVTSMTSLLLESAIASSGGTNEGAITLMEFLRYAESFSAPQSTARSEPNTPLLRSICGILDEAGIAYDVDIGLSDYKVQIGIKRPPCDYDDEDGPGEGYVLGILTDEQGLVGQSVRDLVCHKDSVLSGKYAWDLYHVYILSWFRNYEVEKEALLTAVRRALSKR